MRVLIIDDNPDDRKLVEHELLAAWPQAQVIEPTDLAAFTAALAEAPPALVLTDLELRWSNGRTILAAVKQAWPECPVIMFTGTGSEMIAVELIKSGLDDYVVKSARQLPRLRASIRIAVEAAKARRGLSEREAQLTAALALKDLVLQELHHRVKNNLQIITSLLLLRASKVGQETRMELENLAGRMQALSAVQARIYRTDALDNVDFRAVLGDIVQSFIDVYGGGQVTLRADLNIPLELEVGRAMPLGLLCYEIILNALKHAWPDGRPGRLEVELDLVNNRPTVQVRDDGVGFVESETKLGFGSQLNRAITRQANIELSIVSEPGAGTTVIMRLL